MRMLGSTPVGGRIAAPQETVPAMKRPPNKQPGKPGAPRGSRNNLKTGLGMDSRVPVGDIPVKAIRLSTRRFRAALEAEVMHALAIDSPKGIPAFEQTLINDAADAHARLEWVKWSLHRHYQTMTVDQIDGNQKARDRYSSKRTEAVARLMDRLGQGDGDTLAAKLWGDPSNG